MNRIIMLIFLVLSIVLSYFLWKPISYIIVILSLVVICIGTLGLGLIALAVSDFSLNFIDNHWYLMFFILPVILKGLLELYNSITKSKYNPTIFLVIITLLSLGIGSYLLLPIMIEYTNSLL